MGTKEKYKSTSTRALFLAIRRVSRRNGQRRGLVRVPHCWRSWMRYVVACARWRRRRRCGCGWKAQAWICGAWLGRPSTLRCWRHGRVATSGFNGHEVDQRGIVDRGMRWRHGRGWPGRRSGRRAEIPTAFARNRNVRRALLGGAYLRRAILAPGAANTAARPSATALARAHWGAAKQAHAHAELSSEAALPPARFDVGAHLDLGGGLSPIHRGRRAAVPALAGLTR